MRHEVCIETEFQIPNFEAADNLLHLINHKKIVTLDKDRLVYKVGKIKVVIDDIKNYKTGIELEVVSNEDPQQVIPQLKKLAKKIGIDLKKEITNKSVTHLYMQKFAKF